MIGQRLGKGLLMVAVFTSCLALVPALVHAAGPGGNLSAGMTLPEFKFPAPGSAEDAAYLGVKAGEPFALAQISGKMVIIEVLDVF